MMKCPYCNDEYAENTAACPNCSYPALADSETQRQFLYIKLTALEAEVDDAVETVSKTKYIFFFAAAIASINAVSVFANAQRNIFLLIFGVVIALIACGLVYMGLKIEKNPILYATIGLAISLVVTWSGLLGILSFVSLIVCIVYAVKLQNKELKAKNLRATLEDWNGTK